MGTIARLRRIVSQSLEQHFPSLTPSGYAITSPKDRRYNCVAWAVGDQKRWWWPDPAECGYWPDGVSRVVPPIISSVSDETSSILCRVAPEGSWDGWLRSQWTCRALPTGGHRWAIERGPSWDSSRGLPQIGLNDESARASLGSWSTPLAHEGFAAR